MRPIAQHFVSAALAAALLAGGQSAAYGGGVVAGQSDEPPMAGKEMKDGSDDHSHDRHHDGDKGMSAHQHGALEPMPGGAQLEGAFIGTDGEEIGKVFLADTPTGLLVRIDVNGISPGFHGVHLHETGMCEPEKGFKSAGGHANPRGTAHGFLTEKGSHGGDLPNAFAHEERHIRTDLFKKGYSLSDFQDEDGFAVMVHEKGDDYESQPSGAAGSRVACAPFPAG